MESNQQGALGPSLSVVLPAYRAADFLAHSLAELAHYLERRRDALQLARGFELVVVDDGSDDGTADVAERTGRARVLRLPRNRGKGAAVRAGMLAAGGDVRLFMDCDVPYKLDVVDALLAEIRQGAHVAIGDRSLPESRFDVEPGIARRLLSLGFTLFVSQISLRGHRDTQCGVKAFRADAAQALFGSSVVESFAFDVEILYHAHKRGCRVTKVPVSLVQDSPSTVRLLNDPPRMLRDLIAIPLRYHWGRLRR